MHFQFANVLVFFFLGVILVGLMMCLGSLVRPKNPDVRKLSTYECGELPTGDAWINFNIRFYLIALVFVIFDVELAFVYPVAVVFRDWLEDGRGLFALVEIGLGGELRRVSRLDVRLAEAARLGFRRMLVPAVCHKEFAEREAAARKSNGSTTGEDAKCELVPIEEIAQAVDWLHRFGTPAS